MQDRAFSTNDERHPAKPGRDRDLAHQIEAAWPVASWRDVHVAVAVSGGADSVALLRGLHAAKQRAGGRGGLSVLHFDHAVRGEASAEDARWVEELAAGLGLACQIGRNRCPASPDEASLREARRGFLRQAVARLGVRYLATGHTADDQAETVLFRALRGSGLRGLAGIRPTAPLSEACTLIRPLLGTTRLEIEAYLASLGQAYREDASNQQTNYTRNWLRHRVLPLIEERLPEARQQLTTLAEHAAESAGCLEELADELLSASASGMTFDRAAMASRPASLVAESIRLAWRRAGWPEQAMTAPAWRRLAELARSGDPQPAEMFAGGVRAESVGGKLVLSRPTAD